MEFILSNREVGTALLNFRDEYAIHNRPLKNQEIANAICDFIREYRDDTIPNQGGLEWEKINNKEAFKITIYETGTFGLN